MDQLGFLSIFVVVDGWNDCAILGCGALRIRAPIEKERGNGKEGWRGKAHGSPSPGRFKDPYVEIIFLGRNRG
jgi:hypothetical protein